MWMRLIVCLSLLVTPALGQLPGVPAPAPAEAESPAAAPAPPPPPAEPDVTQELGSFVEELRLDALLADNGLNSWLFLLGAIFVGLVLGKLAAWVLRRSGERLERRGWIARSHVLCDAASPASLALLAVGLSVGLSQINMSEPLKEFSAKVLLLLFTIAIFWYAFNLVAIVEVALRKLTAKTTGTLDDQLVPIVRKTLRIFLVVIAVLFIVDAVFEKDIGAWLAGLGIAGLAVSLAAQDSLKNLFGSVTIFMDRPFQVGERIRYGGFDGTIEEIGFRSCKMRTLEGHLVTIPNGNIVNDPIENVSQRPHLRRILNITITYDTPREKIHQARQILVDILNEPGIREPIYNTLNGEEWPPRVVFDKFNADSLNLFVIYWYMPVDWWGFQYHAEKVNFRIFEEFEKAGIEFAFPTQTLYLAGDPKRKLAVEMMNAGMPER
jgi:MscS family membrane protein